MVRPYRLRLAQKTFNLFSHQYIFDVLAQTIPMYPDVPSSKYLEISHHGSIPEELPSWDSFHFTPSNTQVLSNLSNHSPEGVNLNTTQVLQYHLHQS